MEAVLGLLAVSGIVLVALVVGLVVAAVQAARAAARRGSELADRARIQVRALGGGVAGEVARLHRELTASVSGARNALVAARAAGVPLGDAPALVYRLRLAARDCHTELTVIDAVPDPGRAAALLPAARARAADVRAAAADLADGLARAAGECASAAAALRRECAMESDALRTGARAAHRPLAG
jgi:hypothetical protein